MGITLVAENGELAGYRFELPLGTHEIGFGGAAIDLGRDEAASALHAVITVSADGVTVRDAGSEHGTFLNGHRIEAAPLHGGDVLQCGTTRFRIEETAADDGPACPGCGLTLTGEPKICPRCGRDLTPVHAADVPAEAPAARFCSHCGKPLPPGGRFCPACGHDAAAAADTTATATAPAALPRWVVATLIVAALLALLACVGAGVAVGMLLGQARLAARVAPAPTAEIAGLDAQLAPEVTPPADTPAPSVATPAEAAAAGGPPPAWRSAGRVRLRYGGRPGQRFTYRATSKITGGISVIGQNFPLDLDTATGYSTDVVANDGRAITYRLAMNPSLVSQSGQPYSGALPSAPAPITFTMDPSGRVLSVQGAGAESSVAPGLPPELQFNYEAILRQLSAMAFPDRELAVGDTWSNRCTVPTPGGGSITFNAECRLDGFETVDGHHCARIVTQLDVPIQLALTQPGAPPVQTTGSLAGAVTSYFDPDEGALVRSDSDLALKMTMQSPVAGGAETEKVLRELGVGGAGSLAEAVKLEASGTVRSNVRRAD